MHLQGEPKGVILLGERMRGRTYETDDLEFLYSLSNLACASVENARLFKEAIEKQRLEDELNIAREIQQGLLPHTLPTIDGYDLSAINISSKQVGGDYYDVIRRERGDYVLAIGDVSGKGTPAALLMANVQATLRAFTPMDLSLAEITSRINNVTCKNVGQGRFITLFWGIFDPSTRKLRYVNAGHNPPFLFRGSGTVERLTEGGLILGLTETSVPYLEGEVTLESRDVLLLFTDGVSEAMNAEEEDFTEERLAETVLPMRTESSKEIMTAIQKRIQEHTHDAPQSDDVTMLIVRVR
jgi:phosphoserine phosphatase RsbU/P